MASGALKSSIFVAGCEQPDRARDHGTLRVRKDPGNELGGRLPLQTLRDGGMVNADRQQSSERPQKAGGNSVLQRRRAPLKLVACDVSRRLIEQPHLQRFAE